MTNKNGLIFHLAKGAQERGSVTPGKNYTPKQIADWSTLSASMVRKEIKAGKLIAHRFGDRKLIIRGEDALRWFESKLVPINSDVSRENIASFGGSRARGADIALASVRTDQKWRDGPR